MHRVATSQPFAWVRWADGDMINVKQMDGMHAHWRTLPNLYVAVGTWWMCSSFLDQWNSFLDVQYAYIDYFYLPMGDPCDTGMADQRRHGVNGFLVEAFKATRHIVMIGPSILQNLPFVTTFFDEAHSDQEILRFVDQQPRHSLVLLSKGTHAKRIITLSFLDNVKNHSFVDVGRSLLPYVGQAQFGRPVSSCCGNTDVPHVWFKPGVCK